MKQLICGTAIFGLLVAGAACSVDHRKAGNEDEVVIRTDREAVDEAKGTAGEALDKAKAGAESAAEKTKAAAETAAEKAREGVAKTGEVINDAWITTKVKSQFAAADALKGSDISVDTTDHVVTLSGTAPNAAARVRAVEIAKTTDGVTRVVNRVTIAPHK